MHPSSCTAVLVRVCLDVTDSKASITALRVCHSLENLTRSLVCRPVFASNALQGHVHSCQGVEPMETQSCTAVQVSHHACKGLGLCVGFELTCSCKSRAFLRFPAA